MNYSLKSFLFGIYLLLCGLWPLRAQSAEGGWTSGGGDTVAMEFVSLGYQIHDMLLSIRDMNRRDPLKDLVDLKTFKTKLEEAKVESTSDKLHLNGVEVDAINYPAQNKITVSRDRWRVASSASYRAGLVFHEYLGLMLDDARYEKSSKLLERVKNDPLGFLEGFRLYCETSRTHAELGKIKFDIFNISEHYAWIRLDAEFEKESLINKVLREKLNGGDEFSFAGARGSFYVELFYVDIWGIDSSYMNLIFVGESSHPTLFESNVSCQKLKM